MTSFPDRRAKFRSRDTVEQEANLVRRWGGISQQSTFNIIDLIKLTLPHHIKDFSFQFDHEDLQHSPAFVKIKTRPEVTTLYVREAVWNLAGAKHEASRFILAHEIGHIKLHRHDILGFSGSQSTNLIGIEDEERAEPQANHFADCLLVAEHLLNEFTSIEEIIYFFNVPEDCARRRFESLQDKLRRRRSQYEGSACSECGNFALIRNGPHLECNICKKHG